MLLLLVYILLCTSHVFGWLGCKVSFLTDASDFQLLTPKNADGSCPAGLTCEAKGRFSGAVTIGYGSACVPARRNLRELEDGGTAPLKFEGDLFTLAVQAVEEPEGCTAFFLVCWFQSILAWLTSLFSF